MNNECLMVSVTAVGSPIRAEVKLFGLLLTFVWQIWVKFLVGVPLCNAKLPS